MLARVLSVKTERIGSVLSANATAADTVLYVQDITPFEESGTLEIGAESIAYTTYISEDEGIERLDLATALTGNYTADEEPVYTSPQQLHKTAIVSDGQVDYVCEVASPVWPQLPDGARQPDAGEMVVIQDMRVVGLSGQTPGIYDTAITGGSAIIGDPTGQRVEILGGTENGHVSTFDTANVRRVKMQNDTIQFFEPNGGLSGSIGAAPNGVLTPGASVNVQQTIATAGWPLSASLWRYQTFQIVGASAIVCSKLSMYGAAGFSENHSPDWSFQVELRDNSGNRLAGGMVTWLTTAAGWADVALDQAVTLQPSTTYRIAAKSSYLVGASWYCASGGANGPYADGAWSEDSSYDAAFKVWAMGGQYGGLRIYGGALLAPDHSAYLRKATLEVQSASGSVTGIANTTYTAVVSGSGFSVPIGLTGLRCRGALTISSRLTTTNTRFRFRAVLQRSDDGSFTDTADVEASLQAIISSPALNSYCNFSQLIDLGTLDYSATYPSRLYRLQLQVYQESGGINSIDYSNAHARAQVEYQGEVG